MLPLRQNCARKNTPWGQPLEQHPTDVTILTITCDSDEAESFTVTARNILPHKRGACRPLCCNGCGRPHTRNHDARNRTNEPCNPDAPSSCISGTHKARRAALKCWRHNHCISAVFSKCLCYTVTSHTLPRHPWGGGTRDVAANDQLLCVSAACMMSHVQCQMAALNLSGPERHPIPMHILLRTLTLMGSDDRYCTPFLSWCLK